MTLLLLHTCHETADSLKDPNQSIVRYWARIASVMMGNGYDLTGVQCRHRFDYLKACYKDTKDHNKTSGNERMNRKDLNRMN